MKRIKDIFGIICLLIVVSMLLFSCSNEMGNSTIWEENEAQDDIKYISKYSMEYLPKSLEDLITNSELIVRAKMVNLKPSVKRNGLVVTDHIFEILEVYSGDKKAGENITVEMLGGILKDTKYVANQEKSVNIEDEVILILSYPMDENDKISSRDYYVYYPPAGIYFKTNIISDKHEEQFVANDPSYSFDLSTIQSKIDDIKKDTKISSE